VPILDRDGVDIHFAVHGDGPRTMLLSHGWGASSTMSPATSPRSRGTG